MSNKVRAYAPQTLDAVQVLGNQIALARRRRRWTSAELAERVGVSVRTISNLEHGSPSVTIGVAFEAASILGVSLFGAEGPELAALVRRGQDTLALLPSRVYPDRLPADDNF